MPRSSLKKSDIPVGTQFSPSLISLPEFIGALIANSGDKGALEQAVWQPSVRTKPRASAPTRRNSSLPIEAAVQYGLLDTDYNATALAQKLASLDGSDLYTEFARHILLNCGGLRVLDAIAQMQADNLEVTGDSLARFLTEQGFIVTEHNTAINSLRMWLAKAGLFPERGSRSQIWSVNKSRREEIVPLDDDQIAILAGLDISVRAFVRALCRLRPEGWVRASDIRDAAESTEHVRIDRSSLPNAVLRPLKAARLIDFTTQGTSSGKSSTLRLTDRFKAEILEPFVTRTVLHLDGAIAEYYRERPKDIFKELDSADSFVKGKALEAFAIMIMRQLGLRFVAWRMRARESGQAEVDVLLSGIIGAVQTRWQVQCKNTPRSNVDIRDVASEIGLTVITQATHLLILTRSAFTADARSYAQRVMQRVPLSIFLLDKGDFVQIRSEPSRLLGLLRRQSEEIGIIQASLGAFDR